MKLRWVGALGLVIAPVACTLVVDTGGLAGGTADGGNTTDGPIAKVDGASSSNSSSSSSIPVDGSVGVLDGNVVDSPPDVRFCSTVRPDQANKLLFCDDFDDDRIELATGGWSFLPASGGTDTSGLSVGGEPVLSAPRAARIVQGPPATSNPRARLTRAISQGEDFSLHFKFYRASASGSPVIAALTDGTCTITIAPTDISSFCPAYSKILTIPVMPEKTWNEVTIVIEEHSPTSRFFITTPGIKDKRVDVSPITFNSLELGQAVEDATQTVFYDDVWAEGKAN